MKTTYYKLVTRSTSAENQEDPNPEIFDTEAKCFKTLKDVKEYLKKKYYKIVPTPMYVDVKKKRIRVGWIFGFHNDDNAHDGMGWWQEDWVELRLETVERALLKPSEWKLYQFEK